jgi:indole-3-glycerol phosphate synthase
VNILERIITAKRVRLENSKSDVPLAQLRNAAQHQRANAQPHALLFALNQTDRLNVIAEFKRRSPSKGVICHDADAVRIARCYEEGGAAAISVLTEEDFFEGSLADLRAVRQSVKVPVLRKDFIFDPYQVYEAAAAGAAAILLIVASLDNDSLGTLRRTAEEELGLDALVEVHTAEEMERAGASGASLIGVNNRNLQTFEVSLETSVSLAKTAPNGSVLISESGLHTRTDLERLRGLGYQGFLIGESLMRATAPDQAVRALLQDG